MSDYGRLPVQVRNSHGKGAARSLRRKGLIPAVLYGRGQDNLSLAVDPHVLGRATDPRRAWNTFFQLTVKRDGQPDAVESCIVTDVQIDSARHNVIHVDFLRVDPQLEVVRRVAVRTTGRALGVMKGGRIKTFRRDLLVAAKPGEMPFEVVIDVTPLDDGQYLRTKDVALDNARIHEDPETALAFCESAKAVAAEAKAAEAAEAAEAAAAPAAAAAAAAAAPAAAAATPAAGTPAPTT